MITQAIRKQLEEKKAQKAVEELFEEQKAEEMLEYIRIYADSVASDKPEDEVVGSRANNMAKVLCRT